METAETRPIPAPGCCPCPCPCPCGRAALVLAPRAPGLPAQGGAGRGGQRVRGRVVGVARASEGPPLPAPAPPARTELVAPRGAGSPRPRPLGGLSERRAGWGWRLGEGSGVRGPGSGVRGPLPHPRVGDSELRARKANPSPVPHGCDGNKALPWGVGGSLWGGSVGGNGPDRGIPGSGT